MEKITVAMPYANKDLIGTSLKFKIQYYEKETPIVGTVIEVEGNKVTIEVEDDIYNMITDQDIVSMGCKK